MYLWPIPGREPNVSWGPGFAGAWSELFDARLPEDVEWYPATEVERFVERFGLTRASAMRRLRPICGTFFCCEVLPRARPKRP